MNFTDINEVIDFVKAFEDYSLEKKQWTHKAHFIIGLWYVVKYDYKAIDNIREKIKSYNVSKGVMNTDSNGYHETITVFYLWAIEKFIKENNFEKKVELDLFHKLLNSYVTDKDFPFEYYSKDRLFSKEARENYVSPDVKELIN